jgi:hypothetical protein
MTKATAKSRLDRIVLRSYLRQAHAAGWTGGDGPFEIQEKLFARHPGWRRIVQ